MSEKIGCMNCGNISCKNNKKRESKGCGRWKTPEQRILELEEKVGMAERTRDRLISIGFPTFASCKEYAAKLKELEKEVTRLRNENLDIINKYTRSAETDRRTIAELEAQIEKMKCCENCQTVRDAEGNCYLKKDGKCKDKDKWELRR